MGSCLSSPIDEGTKPAASASAPATAVPAKITLVASKRQAPIKVAAVSADNKGLAIGAAHVARLKAKHHRGKTPSTVKKNATGDEPLTDIGQEELWTCQMSLGTPAQTLPLDLDTGSSDVFVNPKTYLPTSSSTAVDAKRKFSVAYGDGTNASGEVYNDVLEIGGLIAPSQAIGVATQSTLQDDGNSGIAGMAFQSIAQTQSPPFFDSIYEANKATIENLFTFALWTENASVGIGHIDSTKYKGEIAYSPIDDSQGFWTTDFDVNGTAANGIIDTGTTLIIAPTAVAKSILDKAGFEITTDTDGSVYGLYDPASPPGPITLTFGGQAFTLSPEALSFQQQGGKTIASLIGSDMGEGGPEFIVGDSFLQDVFAVFDKGNLRVGFAPKA